MTRLADRMLETAAARAASHQYRLEARRLRRQAAEQAAANQPLTARITRYRALMAEHAAEAETANPETPGFVP